MKFLKALALGAGIAVLLAFAAAGSASATVLCKTTPTSNTCPPEWDYKQLTIIEATIETGTTAILETNSPSPTIIATCTAVTLKGSTSNTGSATETVKGPIEGLTWGTAGTPCSKTMDTLSLGEFEIHWIEGGHNGNLVIKGMESTINTIFGTCVYGSGPASSLGTIQSGNPAKLTVNAILPKISGNFACPSEARFTANFVVTVPAQLYFARET